MPAKAIFTNFGDTPFMLFSRTFKTSGLVLATSVVLMVSACTTSEVLRPQIDVATTQAVPQNLQVSQIQSQIQSQVPADAPVMLVTPDGNVPAPPEMQQQFLQQAAVPNITPPAVSESGANDFEPQQEEPGMLAQLAAMPGRMVPDFLKPNSSDPETQCRRDLKRLGVSFEDVAPVGNGGSCGISNPVRISELSGGIVIKPAAVLNCRMALTFAEWVKKDVQPAARTRYWSGVAEIQNMSSYSCRTIGNKRGGRLSEHSFGNAIDIGGVTLNNGKVLKVRKPGFFALRESSLLNKIRSEACDRFTTVLGPGYNADHADHFHLDLMKRRGSSCN